MGDGAVQAEKMSGEAPPLPSSEPESQELQVPGPSEVPSPSEVPNHREAPSLPESPRSSPSPGATDTIRDGSHVNAITVLTLLDKLVNMLDKVQDNQQRMEKRQIELEGSVKGIQGDLTKLAKSHTSTSNTVSKLLEKSRKVSVNMRDVRDRMDKQCSQVKKLENNHSMLLRRNNFKVLIFQDENEIPTNVLMREPTSMVSLTEGQEEPNNENNDLKDTLHTVELSSDDEIQPDNEGLDDSIDEKLEESRAEKIKSLSLKKVDSLKKAFSRHSLEKHMNKIGTKIVSLERREKIMKSFTQTHHIASAKCPSLKLSPLTFNVKKVRKGETPEKSKVKPEETDADVEPSKENEKISVNQLLSEMASSPSGEKKAIVDSLAKEVVGNEEMNSNPELSATEDNEEFEEGQESSNSKQTESEPKRETEDEEDLKKKPISQPAVLPVDQTA